MTKRRIPLNAVLATTESGTDVFVVSRVGQLGAEKCVGFVDIMEETVLACGSRTRVENEGLPVMNIVDGSANLVAVFVPRQTLSVLFTINNGITEDVAVKNQVAMLQGVPIASLSYTLSSGRLHTTRIHWPRPKGHPVELA